MGLKGNVCSVMIQTILLDTEELDHINSHLIACGYVQNDHLFSPLMQMFFTMENLFVTTKNNSKLELSEDLIIAPI